MHNPGDGHAHSGSIPQGWIDYDRRLHCDAASTGTTAKPELSSHLSSSRSGGFRRPLLRSPRDMIVSGSFGPRMNRFAACFSVVFLSCALVAQDPNSSPAPTAHAPVTTTASPEL